MNFNSLYQAYANSERWWLSIDSKELYAKNFSDPVKKELMKSLGWDKRFFSYKFNRFGFRSDNNFEGSNSILFLGCSYTMGIGLPYECIWPVIVSKKLNLQCVNLGIAGTAADTCFRMSLYWIKKINPKIVVYLQPPKDRFELISNNEEKPIVVLHPHTKNHLDYFLEYISDETNSNLNAEKNKLAIESIAKSIHCKFLYFDSINFFESIDFARDLMHPGIQSNMKASEKVLNLI